MYRASLIIATHSRPQLLPRAVESAVAAGTDVEVIIADDASTDDTARVAAHLATHFPQVKVVRTTTNRRVAGARNLGLEAAQGEYLGFLDDDDIRLPGSLDKQIALLDAHPEAGWCYAQAYKGDEECVPQGEPEPAQPLEGDLFFPLLERNFIHCQTAVFRRSSLDKVGLMDEALAGSDDRDLWLRLAQEFPAVALKEPVSVWRTASPDSGQGTSDYARLLTTSAHAHRTKWQKLPRALREPQRTAQAARSCFDHYANMLMWTAEEGLKKGHKQYARDNLLAALRINPRRSFRPGVFKMLLRSYF